MKTEKSPYLCTTYFDVDGTLLEHKKLNGQHSNAFSDLVKYLNPNSVVLKDGYYISSNLSFSGIQYINNVVTGRTFLQVVEDRKLAPYLKLCSAIIANVGTEIYVRDAKGIWKPDGDYTHHVRACTNYNPDTVRTSLSTLNILTEQPAEFNSELKLSYYAPSSVGTSAEVAELVHLTLMSSGVNVSYPVVSLDPVRGDYNVDLLASNKGDAIAYIHSIVAENIHRFYPAAKILVGAAGDTGNDAASLQAVYKLASNMNYKGFFIAPSNATQELHDVLHALPPALGLTILTPQAEDAGGVLQGLKTIEKQL
jgi:hypothetical protein